MSYFKSKRETPRIHTPHEPVCESNGLSQGACLTSNKSEFKLLPQMQLCEDMMPGPVAAANLPPHGGTPEEGKAKTWKGLGF